MDGSLGTNFKASAAPGKEKVTASNKELLRQYRVLHPGA